MPGLHFYKLDLHTHTPASKCYLNKNDTAEQFVKAAIEKGLAGIAITDHNTAEWIDRIQEAAQDTSLVIFPGVEITLQQGYHLVAIFDPSMKQRDVENFLGAIGIKPEEFGKSETYCTQNLDDVLSLIHDRNGLAILAHIDLAKGLFYEQMVLREKGKVSVPTTCSGLFNSADYDAVETSTGTLPNGFDTEHHFKRFPVVIQSSDNPSQEQPTKHSYTGLGTSYTWYKLDTVNIEGIRQCFADSEVRICLMGQYVETGYSKIISMKIGNDGFLRNQDFQFHAGLNCLIGGKGVGKSLAVELLRFGLFQAPRDEYLLADHVGKLDLQFAPGNWVEIVYQVVDGTQFQIRRTFLGRIKAKSSEIESEVMCKNISDGEQYTGDIARLFPVLAYSQTEVIKIAENKNAQLELIDRFIDTHQFEQEITAIQNKLRDNDIELNAAIHAQNLLESCKNEIEVLTKQIQMIDRLLADPVLDAMKAAEKKYAAFEAQLKAIDELINRIRLWKSDLRNLDITRLPESLTKDKILSETQAKAEQGVPIINQSLETLLPKLTEIKAEIDKAFQAWKPEYDQIFAQHTALLQEAGGNWTVKNNERKQLENQLNDRRHEEQELNAKSKKLPELLKARNVLLDDLERAYRKRYDLRKSKYDQLTELSGKKLRLLLDYSVDRSQFGSDLAELLRGGQNGIQIGERQKITDSISPRRLVALVLDSDYVRLAAEAEITELWAKRVIDKLWSSNDFTQVLRLQHACFPGDIPSIQFRKEGGKYSELDQLSVGQKCTALLIIALCDGTMPVVIDQPEDALDIISVWEDIAQKLRRGKNTRQFILTTHNSSVAVASDSDQFIVLKAEATFGQIIASGAIDRLDVRQAVIDHLEGGNEPYKLRARKYNIH